MYVSHGGRIAEAVDRLFPQGLEAASAFNQMLSL